MEKSAKRSFFKTHFWDRLNVLRAGILGANDGIISVSGIVLGAAGANFNSKTLFVHYGCLRNAGRGLLNGWWRMDVSQYSA